MTETLAELRQEWARTQLEISPNASLDDATRRFLEVIDEEDYVPYEQQVAAFDLLAGTLDSTDVPGCETLAMEEERVACAAVAEFAQVLRSRPAHVLDEARVETERHNLERSLVNPRAAVHYQMIKPAIWFVEPEIDSDRSPHVAALAKGIVEMSTLCPAARGKRRRQWLETAARDAPTKLWSRVGHHVLRQYPELAENQPWLVEQMIATGGEIKRVKSDADKAAPAKKQAAGSTNGGKYGWWIAISVAIAAVRLLGNASHTTNYNPGPMPNYSAPENPHFGGHTLTDAELEGIRLQNSKFEESLHKDLEPDYLKKVLSGQNIKSPPPDLLQGPPSQVNGRETPFPPVTPLSPRDINFEPSGPSVNAPRPAPGRP